MFRILLCKRVLFLTVAAEMYHFLWF